MKPIPIILNSVTYRVFPRFARYQNNTLAVILEETRDNEEFCVLSVNMPGASDFLPDGAFYVKDWSENEPVAAQLIRLGYLQPAPEVPPAQSGFVEARAYRWNENPKPAQL